MFEQITVNITTGAIAYPRPEGFVLDVERVYSTAELFMKHCSPEMAVRHAIHGQLQAYIGAAPIRRMLQS